MLNSRKSRGLGNDSSTQSTVLSSPTLKDGDYSTYIEELHQQTAATKSTIETKTTFAPAPDSARAAENGLKHKHTGTQQQQAR